MSSSKRCYTLVRDLLLPHLPHPGTVQQTFAFFRITPGFITQTFTYLLAKSKLDSWKPEDFLMSFCFDECAISEVGMLDMFNECIVGPHSEAFLIMARGLVGKWQVPIYVNFDVKAKVQIPYVKSQLVEVYEETIQQLEKINFKVLATISDQGGKNQGLASYFNVTPENYLIPIPSNPSRNLIFLYDFVHVFKLFRNHVISDYFKLPSGKYASKSHFSSLIDATKKSNVSISAAVFPLNDYCLNLKGSDRQNVSTALKLFSHETGAMFRKLYPGNPLKLELADMCETMSDGRNAMSDCEFEYKMSLKMLHQVFQVFKSFITSVIFYTLGQKFSKYRKITFEKPSFSENLQV